MVIVTKKSERGKKNKKNTFYFGREGFYMPRSRDDQAAAALDRVVDDELEHPNAPPYLEDGFDAYARRNGAFEEEHDYVEADPNAPYEDYLATFGIRRPVASLHKPELIRYVRDWQYPTNVVDPISGVPASAVSWAFAERADKDRFFTEPGFIFGVSVLRPKTYMDEQRGSAAHMLEGGLSWLPALMSEDPASSLKLIDNATGPIEGTTNDYWVDLRDLYLYGDQFINLPEGQAGYNMISLPDSSLKHYYASDTDMDGLFVTADTAVFGRQDGVVSLQILGRQVDQT